MVEKDTHFAGQPCLTKMHQADRDGSWLEVPQNDLQVTGRDMIGDLIGQNLRHASA